MPVLFLDVESYYDDAHSLKKLTPPEYILDARWETIGCSVAIDDEEPHWIDGPDLTQYLRGFDPTLTTTVTFNAMFDNCVFAWRHGFIPNRMLCSMRMAAALYGHRLKSVSLANVAPFLQVGAKGHEIIQAKGMRRADLMNNPQQWEAYKRYANNDNKLNRAIFLKLYPMFPAVERKVMDRVLRCAIEPRFVVDKAMLTEHLVDLKTEKQAMLQRIADEAGSVADLDAVADTLRSNGKFTALLAEHGIEVQTKPSNTDPTRRIPALAKTDDFMAELLAHENPDVQALATARLGLRSTIEESRGQRMLEIASLNWPSSCRGNLPIPLKYSAAHTHRLGGDWKINPQNMPTGRGGKPTKLRKSLKAPPGHQIIVADLGQIECRLSAYICGQRDLLAQFANKEDPYAALATKVFGFEVNRKVHIVEGFIGKTGVLGLGYGCGADKFYNMVIQSARSLGLLDKIRGMWTPEMAQTVVDVYRNANSDIRNTWYRLDGILGGSWAHPTVEPVQFGPTVISYGCVTGPGGLQMKYTVLPPDLEDNSGERYYSYGGMRHKIYGAKFLENIIQFVARIVLMNAALRLWDHGIKFALQAHDELVFIEPDDKVEDAKRIIHAEMTRELPWLQGLPLTADVNHGLSYGDCK